MANEHAPHRSRLPGRPAIWLYLIAIVGPTLALLFLGLQSVRRQRQAVASLTTSNLRLSGERVAASLEARVNKLAEVCLRDREIGRIDDPAGGPMSPEDARRLRLLIEDVEKRHPIADQLFVIREDIVRYPIPQASEAPPLEEVLAADGSKAGRRFASLLGLAETLELLEGRFREALTNYRRCLELPVADHLKALALARIARCARKLDDLGTAESTYEQLTQRYGNVSDGFFRPYGIVAALELYDLRKARGKVERERLSSIRVDLAKGRWEVGADQAEYFLAQLKERAPDMPDQSWETGYLHRLRFARVLQDRFRAPASLREGEISSSTFIDRGRSHQLHYAKVAPDTLVGLDVDLTWVQRQLLPQLSADAGLGRGHLVRLVRRGSRGAGPHQASIRFQTLFPFWELWVTPAGPARALPGRDLAVYAGSTILVLTVLALGVFLLLRDVSRETQLNRLRSDFVSGVSHELKTPLTVIRLYTETMLEDDGFRPEERRGFHEIILRESERLTQLVEKALDFGRIDRREKQYQLETGNLASCIAQTVDVYGEFLKRRGFAVETDLATSLPPIVFDRDAVAQAVVNLLDNAAKYSGDSRFIGVRLSSEDSVAVFEVEDRGIGIPPDEREKIFEQFYRSRARSGKGGYGLGLFLVRHIMTAHGGRAEVRSEPGRGSRFRLVFPTEAARS